MAGVKAQKVNVLVLQQSASVSVDTVKDFLIVTCFSCSWWWYITWLYVLVLFHNWHLQCQPTISAQCPWARHFDQFHKIRVSMFVYHFVHHHGPCSKSVTSCDILTHLKRCSEKNACYCISVIHPCNKPYFQTQQHNRKEDTATHPFPVVPPPQLLHGGLP